MKIGIYNGGFVGGVGGTERYTYTLAHCLSKQAEVEILGQSPLDVQRISEAFGIDVGTVSFRGVTGGGTNSVANASAEYEVFINTSMYEGSPVFPRASRSIRVIHFPTPPDGFKAAIARRAIPFVFGLAKREAGFYELQWHAGRKFWWTDGRGHLSFAGLRFPANVVLPLSAGRQDGRETPVRLVANGRLLREFSLPPGQDFTRINCRLPAVTGGRMELAIESPTFRPARDHRQVGVAVGEASLAGPRRLVYEALFNRMLPTLGERAASSRAEDYLAFVRWYHSFWADSEFVGEWTRRYWGVSTSVLYPPAGVAAIAQAAERQTKRPMIISVGRFFEGFHNKKQLEMVEAFRRMMDEGLEGWELRLAGAISELPGDARYLQRVRHAAEGLPVRIVINPTYEALLNLYAESSMYWHAAGLGEDEEKNPIKLEHFGLTPVEAMAAGCVPLVMGKGGPKEVVTHAENGFLWLLTSELTDYTWRLIRDPLLRTRLANAAQRRSWVFSEEAFERRACELLEQTLSRTPASLPS